MVCHMARSKVMWRWKLEILPFSKSISSAIFNGNWQVTADFNAKWSENWHFAFVRGTRRLCSTLWVKKRSYYMFVRIFTKCRPILKILSLLHSLERNLLESLAVNNKFSNRLILGEDTDSNMLSPIFALQSVWELHTLNNLNSFSETAKNHLKSGP